MVQKRVKITITYNSSIPRVHVLKAREERRDAMTWEVSVHQFSQRRESQYKSGRKEVELYEVSP